MNEHRCPFGCRGLCGKPILAFQIIYDALVPCQRLPTQLAVQKPEMPSRHMMPDYSEEEQLSVWSTMAAA